MPSLHISLRMGSVFPPAIFAVPTTAGTGSETTIAAVVSNTQTHEKYPITDPVIRPRYAVLDPVLTVGLPPHITATTAMDAMTHAVESYIGKFCNNAATTTKAVPAMDKPISRCINGITLPIAIAILPAFLYSLFTSLSSLPGKSAHITWM